jgi:NTP pyrophosphatase (non-canonical NTP hydrolase)
MELNDLMRRAIQIRQMYEELEHLRYGRTWNDEEIALGFVGDVGDLAKLIMAHNGMRQISDVEQKLAHELADCLWSVMVLAQRTGVDLEQSFLQTMNELEHHITTLLEDEQHD